jgi:hypothetical protein
MRSSLGQSELGSKALLDAPLSVLGASFCRPTTNGPRLVGTWPWFGSRQPVLHWQCDHTPSVRSPVSGAVHLLRWPLWALAH